MANRLKEITIEDIPDITSDRIAELSSELTQFINWLSRVNPNLQWRLVMHSVMLSRQLGSSEMLGRS